MTDMDLIRVQYGPMWIDNMYVRLRRSSRDAQPQLIESEFDGRAYLTRMTIQGDGDFTQSCQAAKVSAGMLIHGTCDQPHTPSRFCKVVVTVLLLRVAEKLRGLCAAGQYLASTTRNMSPILTPGAFSATHIGALQAGVLVLHRFSVAQSTTCSWSLCTAS